MVLSDRVEDHLGSGGLSGGERSLLPIALFVSFSSTHSQCAQREFTLTVAGLTSYIVALVGPQNSHKLIVSLSL